MKIGIDGRLWNETGVGRYIRNLVSHLLEIDEQHEYIVFVTNEHYKRIRHQESGIRRNFKIIPTDIHWHSFEEQVRFPQILNRENLDLMHFPYFSVPVFYNRPFIVTIHDLIIYHFATGKASTLSLPIYQVKRLGYKAVLRNAVVRAKKIIVPLNAVKKDLVETLHVPEKKIVVTYEGVDLSLRSGSLGRSNLIMEGSVSSSMALRNDKYFLYVGNAYPHKNLEKLIEAFVLFKKNLRDRNNAIKLVFVGKEDYFYKRLHEFVTKDSIADVLFLHKVSDTDLAGLYAHALAFVSASLMEGFGLPALEAMANNCLVFASDIPAFREVCQENAVFFDPNNTKELASRFEEVATNGKNVYKAKIKEAKNRVQFFSWEKMARETVGVYNEIMVKTA